MIGSLQNLKGAEFDKAYIEQVAVGGHQKAVELFRKESEKSNDAALKTAASKPLPVISHTLRHGTATGVCKGGVMSIMN